MTLAPPAVPPHRFSVPAAPGGSFGSGAPAASRHRFLQLWVIVVTLCAFGPYLVGGLRTEQLAVYASALAVGVLGWPLWHGDPTRPTPRSFLVLWGAIFAVAAAGVVWPPFNETSYTGGNAFAGLDNWALPIAVVIVTAFWCERLGSRCVARLVSVVVVLAMMVNAVVSVIARVVGSYGLTPWVELFWQRGDVGDMSVAANALGNERYTGLFNQPIEAGICYSVALLCLAYLARLSTRPRALVVTVVAVVLTVGGLLSVSKVLLFCGLPLFAVQMLRSRGRRLRIAGVLGALVLGGLAIGRFDLVLSVVTDTTQLRSLLGGLAFDTSTLTAGRFGEGGTLGTVANEILADHAVLGLGAGGVSAPYDSAWIEAIATTGVVGAVLLMLVFAVLGLRWWALRRGHDAPESDFAAALIIVVAVASLGMPSMTGNKVATVVWLLLACLLLQPRRSPYRAASQETGSWPT